MASADDEKGLFDGAERQELSLELQHAALEVDDLRAELKQATRSGGSGGGGGRGVGGVGGVGGWRVVGHVAKMALGYVKPFRCARTAHVFAREARQAHEAARTPRSFSPGIPWFGLHVLFWIRGRRR